MAQKRRRSAIGCLPLLILFFIGSTFIGTVEEALGISISGGLIFTVVAIVVLSWIVAVAVRRRRDSEERDRADDGAPTAVDVPVAPQAPPPPRQPSPPPISTRDAIRTGGQLHTEADDPESQALKQRLSEAVADLTNTVDGMHGPGEGTRLITSEEMIARAKDRIRNWDSTHLQPKARDY